MVEITVYVIRHNPTGRVLPQAQGRGGRGGSWVEPKKPSECAPRLFATEKAAKTALAQWVRGRFHRVPRYGDGNPAYDEGYYEDITVEKVPERVKAEMEIVPVKVSLPW